DLVALVNRDDRTVGQLVTLALATEFVSQSQFTGTGNGNQLAVVTGYVLQVMQADGTGALHLYAVLSCSPARRTTDVERTHRQLGTRLTDRLGRDDTHRLPDVDLVTACQVTAVAGRAYAVAGFTGDRRAHQHFVDAVHFQEIDQLLVDQRTGSQQHLLGARLEHVDRSNTAEHALAQRLDDVTTFDMRLHDQTLISTAIHLGDHQVLGYVHQTTGKVTGVGGLQGGIGQTLTGTVGRDEVLKYVQTFTEVRNDRGLADRAVRLGHQTTHTRQLTDLCRGTPGAGVGHHVHGVERIVFDFVAVLVQDAVYLEVVHHRLGDLVVGTGPQVDHLVVLLASGDQTGGVLVLDLFHFAGGTLDDLGLLFRDLEVVDANRRTGDGRIGEPGVHQLVGKDDGFLQTHHTVAGVDQLGDRLLSQRLVHQGERQPLGQDLEQQRAADSGVNQTGLGGRVAFLVEHGHGDADLDHRMQADLAAAIGHLDFIDAAEGHAFALGVHQRAGHVVQTQYHVLRRHDDRLAGGGRQDVVGGHHQRTGFQLGFQRQRYVHGHLVTVEVGVVGGTDQRVQLNGLTFNQYRLERLDTQTVQGRCAVEQHGVFADDLGEDIPHFRQLALDHLL